MRKFRGGTRQFGGTFAAGVVNANTVNINNITQVVQYGCSNGGRMHSHGKSCRSFEGHLNRHSNLPRYLFEGRDPGKLCEESVRTIGIVTHGLGSCASDFAHHACGAVRCAGGVAKGTVGIIAAIFGKDIY